MDAGDQLGQLCRGGGVVADESRDDLGGKVDVVRGRKFAHCEQTLLSGRPCWKQRPGSLWSGSPICSDRNARCRALASYDRITSRAREQDENGADMPAPNRENAV